MRICILRMWLTSFIALTLFLSIQTIAWGANFERRDVTFKSQGLNCAGWYYVPTQTTSETKLPAIVMAHGWSLVKEAYLDKYAEKFAEAGFAVLVFDYRYTGGSEGTPRGQLFYFDQQQDYRNAITWVSLQPEVDTERIGIWGTSNSGGHVLHLGVFDKRVKAVVSQVPGTDVPDRYSTMNSDSLARRIKWQATQRVEQYKTGVIKYFPVIAPIGTPSVFPSKDAYDFFTEVSKIAPNWENKVTVETLEIYREYAPTKYIQMLSPTPLLMIVASNDDLVSTKAQLDAFERAREPKKLVIIEGGHFAVYRGSGFDTAVTEAVEWFKASLK
ncbi:alpha/beta hydrolase [Sporomusaceae bacterium FL31]|nr:alpha/beta hydrolase [Sporomusaceae bacterium FL31]GCE34144.1 alpha/beta hydrolase [Sporomusaceae bacterium]